MSKKDKYSVSYQIGRNLGVPIFNIAFRPKIINSEFIPKEGPIILAGNHLHVWDQCPVMCATKRTIHWMAKKEYFEGNLRLMYKYMGCIPVDRFGNTDNSKNIALDYLNKGNVIGIFPEGTRNHIKERDLPELIKDYPEFNNDIIKNNLLKSELLLSEIKLLKMLLDNDRISKTDFMKYILSSNDILKSLLKLSIITENEYWDSMLLPFKFGAVSMAKKTNSIIVPFGVTGDYTTNNNNLTIEFSNPIVTTNKNLEELNQELRTSVQNVVKKYLKK